MEESDKYIKRIKIEGDVIQKKEHKFRRRGTSKQVVIPKDWLRIFNTPILELNLVVNESGSLLDRYVIVITRPKKKRENKDERG